MTTQLIESLSEAQFKTLQQLVNSPYGIEALRLAIQIKSLKLVYFGTIGLKAPCCANPKN